MTKGTTTGVSVAFKTFSSGVASGGNSSCHSLLGSGWAFWRPDDGVGLTVVGLTVPGRWPEAEQATTTSDAVSSRSHRVRFIDD